MQGGRPKAREILFRVLFETEISGDDATEALEYALGRYHLSEDARDHVIALVRVWSRERGAIDARISARLESWSLARLSVVVRSVLRLGVTELIHAPDVPVEVVLDQAILLAQRYGEDGAGAFVNGVLDRIAGDLRAAEERARANGTGAGEGPEASGPGPKREDRRAGGARRADREV